MSFAGSAALFLLRIGIEGEEGTLSVALKSSVKSVERFEGDKAVASTMAVVFVVKWFFSEDDEAVAYGAAVLSLAYFLLFADVEAAAATMALLLAVDLYNPEATAALASFPPDAPYVVDLISSGATLLLRWQ